jgi:hypothetical protein
MARALATKKTSWITLTQHELGGKAAFLSKFPLLTEDNMPRSKVLKVRGRAETLEKG